MLLLMLQYVVCFVDNTVSLECYWLHLHAVSDAIVNPVILDAEPTSPRAWKKGKEEGIGNRRVWTPIH